MPPRKLDRGTFEERFLSRFKDAAFAPLRVELQAIAAAAWDAYAAVRKAPLTRKADPGFADPDYEIALDWLRARNAITTAQAAHVNQTGVNDSKFLDCSEAAREMQARPTNTLPPPNPAR